MEEEVDLEEGRASNYALNSIKDYMTVSGVGLNHRITMLVKL